jgi:hypothetical protein
MEHKTSAPNPMATLFAQQSLNDALMEELQIGNTDDSMLYASALDALRGGLAVDFARQLTGPDRIRKAALSQADAARDLVYRQYANHVLQARRQYGADVSVVELNKRVASDDVAATVLGSVVNEREQVRHEDPAMRAYLLAKLNVQRAKARCVALEYLVEQLSAQHRVHDSELGRHLTSLYLCLSSRVARRVTTQMKFAMLLGGKPLEETRQDLVNQSFGPEMEVMGYLTFDERRPGSVQGGEEAAFRASIEKHLRRTVR